MNHCEVSQVDVNVLPPAFSLWILEYDWKVILLSLQTVQLCNIICCVLFIFLKYLPWFQGVTGTEDHLGDQANKRQKVNNSGDVRVSRDVTAASSLPANSGLRKSSSAEAAQAGGPQVSLKPVRSPRPRTTSGVSTGHPAGAWGPARFKLDNRTTTFRVLPPLPATIPDVSFILSFSLLT